MQSPMGIFCAQQTSSSGPKKKLNPIWIQIFVYDIKLVSFYFVPLPVARYLNEFCS